jgi:hypothetical protein
LMAYSASVALGQYGLYGSPDPINLTQQTINSAASTPSSGTYPSTSSTYAAPAYTAPQVYTTQQPVQSYTPQQSQAYTAQQTRPYTSQQGQPFMPHQVQPYSTQRMQPTVVQPTQAYASQPVQSYAPQQPQTTTAKPVATYGQMGPQYSTTAYSRPSYYMASSDQMNAAQSTQAQPAMTMQQQMPSMPATPTRAAVLAPTPAPGIQQSPGVMSQMIAEQNQNGSASVNGSESFSPYGNQCGDFRPYINRNDQANCGSTCTTDVCPEPCLWYGSIGGLVMGRDRPNKVFITYETGNEPHNDFPKDELSWEWGGEVRVGRRFSTGCNPCNPCNQGYWGLEASYWTLGNFDGYVSHTSPVSATNPAGTVGTPLIVRYNDFFDRETGFREVATNWFDNAAEHRLWRQDEVHNVELSLVRGQWCYGQDSPWDLGFSLGVRYFRFRESWKFGSLAGPAMGVPPHAHFWGEAGGLYEAYLDDLITNDMVGPQLGFELGYNMWQGMRFYMTPKVGIYNNHITNKFNAYLGNGEISRPTAASGVVGTYPVNSSTDMVSFLTQIDVGLDWKFLPQWSARFGYRVVAISGLGLADAQIPSYIVDIPAIAEIDTNSDLLLHGAFATLTYNF